MYRTMAQFTDVQKAAIAKFCKNGVSQAQLIRQAVDEYLLRHNSSALQEDVFGIWKGKGVDGVEYQNKIRQEW